MRIERDDGTFDGGPLDIWTILFNINTKRFHPVFFSESPLPGPVPSVEEIKVVRLKSRMHHTGGLDTFEKAVTDMKANSEKLRVPETNIWKCAFAWDGEIPLVWITNNWLKDGEMTGGSVPSITHGEMPKKMM